VQVKLVVNMDVAVVLHAEVARKVVPLAEVEVEVEVVL